MDNGIKRQKLYIIGVAIVVLVSAGFSWLTIQSGFNPIWLGIILPGVIFVLGVLVLQKERALQDRQSIWVNRVQKIEKQFEAVVQLNHNLLDVQDEKSLMEVTLAGIAKLSGVDYVSLVPLDEWDQPLPAFTYGPLSSPLHAAWREHLVTQLVKDRCAVCQGKPEPDAGPCPLLVGPFSDDNKIVCLPIRRGRRMLGILNLYLKENQDIDSEILKIIEAVLNEVALVIQGVRLQVQENSTLRQLQLLHSSDSNLSHTIDKLMADLHMILDADGSYLLMQNTDILPQNYSWLRADAWAERILKTTVDSVISTSQPLSFAGQDSEGNPLWVAAVPVEMPKGNAFWGVIAAVIPQEGSAASQLNGMLRSSATQVALLLQGELNRISFEYRAVVEERTRIAREIHDGLAQTLAYLKLNTAQMQTYLNQQNYKRLEDAIKESYRALSEAYLDTREAIDYLRVSPENDFENSLRQLVSIFLESSSIPVNIQLDHSLMDVSPEIKAQILRIVQEALSNIRKHSKATQVQLTVVRMSEDLFVEIQDNGRGFPPEDILENSQHGLRGMRERADLIGADFQIISQPGQGAKIRLRLPFIEETRT